MANATTTRPAVAKNVLSLIARVAASLGREGRKALTETEPAATAYAKAKPEVQAEMRHAWTNAYMASHLSISNDLADTLRESPRFGAKAKVVKIDGKEITLKPRTKEQQQAYDRARFQFGFHISRDKKQPPSKSAPVRVIPAVRDALTAMCDSTFEEGYSKEALERVIEQAKALMAKMK